MKCALFILRIHHPILLVVILLHGCSCIASHDSWLRKGSTVASSYYYYQYYHQQYYIVHLLAHLVILYYICQSNIFLSCKFAFRFSNKDANAGLLLLLSSYQKRLKSQYESKILGSIVLCVASVLNTKYGQFFLRLIFDKFAARILVIHFVLVRCIIIFFFLCMESRNYFYYSLMFPPPSCWLDVSSRNDGYCIAKPSRTRQIYRSIDR